MLTAPRSIRNSVDCPLFTNLIYIWAVSLDHDLSKAGTLLMVLLLFFFVSFFRSIWFYLFLNCFPFNECPTHTCYKVDLRLCIPFQYLRQTNKVWSWYQQRCRKKEFVFIFWHKRHASPSVFSDKIKICNPANDTCIQFKRTKVNFFSNHYILIHLQNLFEMWSFTTRKNVLRRNSLTAPKKKPVDKRKEV